MVSNKLFLVSIVLVGVAYTPAYAQPASATLSHSVEFSGVPAQGSIVVSERNKVVATAPAAIVVYEDSSSVSVVGRVSLPLDGGPYNVLFTVYGKAGEIASAVREIGDLRLEPAVLIDATELKRRLDEQKADLHKWDDQAGEQRSRLRKVQEQANTLASVGRIVDADDELSIEQSESERLAGSLALMKARQLALKSREVSPNFKQREAELSSHLNLLATALKEAQEEGELSGVSKEFQSKRDLIEATKYEHVDLLKDELAQLRRKREALEKTGR